MASSLDLAMREAATKQRNREREKRKERMRSKEGHRESVGQREGTLPKYQHYENNE